MVENLTAKGCDNEVFCALCKADNIAVELNSNVTVSYCYRKWDRLLFHYKQRKIIKSIESKYDISQFDIIHAYTLFTDGNIARFLSEKYNIPFIVAVRNTDVNVFLKYCIHLRGLGTRILEKASKICYLSNSYKETIANKYISKEKAPIIEGKSEVIPNGINDFWLNHVYLEKDFNQVEKQINGKSLKIVFAGRIDKNKNLYTTCKAIELLIKKGWKVSYKAIGRQADTSIVKQLEAKPYFSWVPPKGKEELIDYYRDADIFVMPSFTETFGLVYAEALTQGLPVIYSRGQGFDKQFDDGAVGYSVESNSYNEIADKIELICENYTQIAKTGMEKVKRFSWDTITDRYIEIYRSLV